MKIALFLLIMLCTCFSSTAQNKKPGSNQSLQLDIGFSKHGTGDMQGLIVNTIFIGITPGLQADTNGDTISTVALLCGFKL